MNRIPEFLWLIVRIAVFWCAVYGYGSLVRYFAGKAGYRVPAHFAGILWLILLSVPLSILGIFNRPVLTVLLATGALIGIVILVKKKPGIFRVRHFGVYELILLVFAGFLLLSNTLRASEPQTNPDGLVTYAVQPDRWLSSGRICYIEESISSGLPLTGEIIAAWPASLSSSRTDQLSLLQVFQMSMLLLSAFAAWNILGKSRNGLLITIIACMATSMLAGWASLPKIEMTVLYFSTVAVALLYRTFVNGFRKYDPIPFLAMGLALGTKLTAYVLLPSMLVLVFAIPGYRKFRYLLVSSAILVIIPLAFAVRTVIHTGAPYYPVTVPLFEPDEDYVLKEIPELTELARMNAAPNDQLVNTEPDPLFVNISKLISSWGLPALLFLLGLISLALRRKLSLALFPLLVVLVYCLLASLIFNPLRWGAKYAFLLSPFMAAVGAGWIEKVNISKVFFFLFLLYVLVTSSMIPRFRYTEAFPGMSASLDFRPPNAVLVKPLQEWCNENLPAGSRLLSVWKRERYFSDNEVIVLENHPLSRRLFLLDSLDEEMKLLHRMRMDYIYFQTADPMPDSLEEKIQLLQSDRLEFVTEVSGFTLCRIIY